MERPLAFDEFESRVEAEPDLVLGWQYWNWLLPETAPWYFCWFILLVLDDWRIWNEQEVRRDG